MFWRGREGYGPARLLTDLSGPYYILVMETTYQSLSDFDTALNEMGKPPAWGKWYKTFTPLVQSGRREILTIVG